MNCPFCKESLRIKQIAIKRLANAQSTTYKLHTNKLRWAQGHCIV